MLPSCRASMPKRPGSSCSASTTPIPSAPTGRRWRTWRRARPVCALVFEGAPNAFGYGLPATRETLDTVLAGIPLNRIHLRIDVHPASRAMADWLVAYLTKQRADPAKLSLSFGIDPAAIFAGTGRLFDDDRGAAGVDAAVARAFLRARRAGRAARSRRPRLPQCGRDRGAGARRDARFRRRPSQAVRGCAPGACLRRAAYRFCRQRRSGPVPVDGQGQGAAQALGEDAGRLLDTALGSGHPRRNVMADDDDSRSGDQHPALDDRLFRGGDGRRRFDLGAAAHDRAWPARRLRAPHCPQRAARDGGRKPCRFRRRSRIGLRRHRGLDRRFVREGLGRVPADRNGGRHSEEPCRRAFAEPHRRCPRRAHPRNIATGNATSSERPSIASTRRSRSSTLAAEKRPMPTDGAVFCERLDSHAHRPV